MARRFQKLTRAATKALRSGSIMEHGIEFSRLANGDGRFSVNVMVDGQRVHRVIGCESDGVTRTQAEEFIEKARTDARHGRLNLPRARKTVLRFSEAAARYLSMLAEEGGKDLKAKKWRLDLHLVPFFGHAPLASLAAFEIERYKKRRADEGAKAGTINRELAVVSHLMNKAVEWGWMSHRAAKLRRLKEDRGRVAYLTVEQALRLREAAKEEINPLVHPFVVIGLETGMRRMEILGIRKEHINLAQRTIFIPEAKAGSREQPITDSLALYLRDYMVSLADDTPWLFPSPASRTGHATDIRKAFRRAVVAAGLDPDEIVRHTLRHTAITHLVQLGVDLPTVKRISGHKTLAMVERYAHANGEHIRAAMDKLDERYRSKTGTSA